MLGQRHEKVYEAVQEKWRVHRWKVLRSGRREVRYELLWHEVRAARTRQLTEPCATNPATRTAASSPLAKSPGLNDRGILLHENPAGYGPILVSALANRASRLDMGPRDAIVPAEGILIEETPEIAETGRNGG